MEFKKPLSFTAIKKFIGNSAHLEARRGSREQAKGYCSKTDTRIEGPWEYGVWTDAGQGKRSDIAVIINALKEGKTENQIIDEHPEEWAKHYRLIDRFTSVRPIRRQHRSTLEIHIGPPGTGKSSTVNAMSKNAYWKHPGKWWDGYDGLQEVILDEAEKLGLSIEYFLKLADWFPFKVEVKGGHRDFNSKRIFATSNLPVEQWFPNSSPVAIQALMRRIDSVTTYSWKDVGTKRYVVTETITFNVQMNFEIYDMNESSGVITENNPATELVITESTETDALQVTLPSGQ